MTLKELEDQRLREIVDVDQMEWIRNSVVLGVKDMRKMTTEEVMRFFSRGSGSALTVWDRVGFSLALLLRTLIWQNYLLVRAGLDAPLRGNLRSFWYRVVEPFCVKHKLFEPPPEPTVLTLVEDSSIPELDDVDAGTRWLGEGGDRGAYVLGTMGKSVDEFVRRAFFTFKLPFVFMDPRESFHSVGADRPAVIFFTEKEGLWWLAQEFARTYGIGAMASHGEPGLLTMEYFAAQLKLRKVKNLYIGELTDYDPWGYGIGNHYCDKLELPIFGFKTHVTHLTSLKLFTPETIEYTKRDLTKVSENKKSQVEEWVRLTGGINGEPYSLHVDNAEMDRIRAAVKAWCHKLGIEPKPQQP